MHFTVRTNAEGVAGRLRHLALSQLPFATAQALSDSARDLAPVAGATMEDAFDLRARSMTRIAFTSQRARKVDWPRPQAIVHLRPRFAFLEDHAVGKTRKAGAHRIAVRTSLVRRTKTGKVRQRHKPRSIRDQKRGSVGRVGGSDVVRLAKGGRARIRAGIFYTLHKQVRIRPTWEPQDAVQQGFEAVFPMHFHRRLSRAIATRR